MKQLLSIFAAVLILVTGMHVSVSAHFCHGYLVAGNVSVGHEKVSCGMEDVQSGEQADSYVWAKCCDDVTSTLTVDDAYGNPASQALTPPHAFELLWANVAPQIMPQQYVFSCALFHADAGPPGLYMASEVSLPGICVFRI
ncbi:MAG: hypothetical protein QM786_19135 [Breznakibacter sp.]